jgi:hypothetical protein
MVENMRDSIEAESTSSAFENFEQKIKQLADTRQFKGILEYLLSVKPEILSLPISHKSAALTFQRLILLVLPILKTQEKKAAKDPKTYEDLKRYTLEFSTLIEESSYPLSVRVNS